MPERDEQGREKYMRGQPREVDLGALFSHMILASSPEGEIGGPRSDPMAIRAWRRKQPFPGQLTLGKVVDIYPSFGTARVFAGKAGLVPAIMPASSFSFTGTRSFHSIQEGSTVLLYLDPKGGNYILAPVPDQPGVGSLFLPEWLVQGGGTHMYSEWGEYRLLRANRSVRMLPNRPIVFDSQAEELITTPTGMTFHFDPFLASIHLNEMTGIFLFLWDQLLRLGGMNLEFMTPLMLHRILTMNQGFLASMKMSGLFVADLIGRHPDEIEDNDLKKIIEDPTLSLWRPKPEDWADRIFYRQLDLEGVWTSGRTMFMAAQGVNDEENLDARIWPASQLDHASYLGTRLIAAASMLALFQHPLLPAPVLERALEDSRDIDFIRSVSLMVDPPGVSSYAADRPLIQFLIENFVENLYRVLRESETWKVPDEEDFEVETEYVPKISVNMVACYNQNDSVADRKGVNHLHETTWGEYTSTASNSVNASPAGFFILDDGGILISDGYGSEIIMRKGHIHISCPGNLAISSGMATLVLGGQVDVVGQVGARLGSNEGNVVIQTEKVELENLEVKNVLLANILDIETLVTGNIRAGSVCASRMTATIEMNTNNLNVYGNPSASTPFFSEISGSLPTDQCSDPKVDETIMQVRSYSDCQTKFPKSAYLIMPRWAYTETELGEMKGEVLNVGVIGPKDYLPVLISCERPCEDDSSTP